LRKEIGNKYLPKSNLYKRFLSQLVALLVLVSVLSSCVGPLFYGKDKYILSRNTIKGNKELDSDFLVPLMKQKPNRKVLTTTPYAYVYILGRKSWDSMATVRKIEAVVDKYDKQLAQIINNPTNNPKRDSVKQARLEKKKENKINKLNKRRTEGNFWMRIIGEKPAYYDSALNAASKIELQKYYFQHGFFEAKVTARSDTNKNNKVNAVFTISEGKRHFFRSVKFVSADTNMAIIMNQNTRDCNIKPNAPFDLALEEAERGRVEMLMRNSGYLAFSRSSVVIDNDTADASGQTDVIVSVVIPENGPYKQYKIGEVTLVIHESEEGFNKTDTTIVRNVNFISERNYNWRILRSKMLLKPGDIYRQDRLNNSQIALNGMDMFRFVNIRIDTANKSVANLFFETTRLPRYQLSDEVGLLVSAGAPGPFANVSLRTRNFLNNWSTFEVTSRFSQEGQISVFLPGSVYKATEVGISTSLYFPRLLLPGKNEYFYSRINPRTRITIGFTNSRRPEYSRKLLRTSFTYGIKPTSTTYIEFSPLDATIGYTPYINPVFKTQLEQYQKSLQQSFNNFFISSFTGSYTYNKGQMNSHNRYAYARFTPEVGGLLGSILSRTNGNAPDSIANLKVFKYWRMFGELRQNWPLGAYSALAFRVLSGYASPIGNSNTLPWEKFFFSGGTSSLRAWPPRRLGPGSYNNSSNTSERPGEIQLEANLELRQKLFKFLEGALFIDAGNIWVSKAETSQPGADFALDRFYKEIAVGTGFGTRFNFSFFILRFDFAVKVYDPSQKEGYKYVLPQQYKHVTTNFGVGYPF